MGVLEFEVLPEMALKSDIIELVLGTPVNQVIAALQNASKHIRNVDLVYSKEEPWKKDITMVLKNEGIRLLFDPTTQSLKLIEVFDFKNIILKYSNVIFSSPECKAHVSKIEKCFGATHPGVYDEKQKIFVLQWRGVYFCFPAQTSAIQPSYAHGFGSLHFDPSTLPSLDRMTVFSGTNPTESKVPEVPLVTYCGNSLLHDVKTVVENNRIVGLKFAFLAEDTVPSNSRRNLAPPLFERVIKLGDSEQHVLANLGAPSRVFHKSEDKMLIQRGSNQVKVDDNRPDMFYNYFTLGTDVLIDNETRRVIKFVLHTNVPGHYDFGIYSRCNFSIEIPGTNKVIQTESMLDEYREVFFTAEEDEDGNLTGDRIMKPVVVNKSSTNGGENPFGSTFCYGREQLIVECLDDSHLATVILFQDTVESGGSETESNSNLSIN